jgi:adenylosuccinate lyase
VCGLARLLRGYAHSALENQALWHERDISHSSVERVILPDAFQLADFMAAELTRIVRDLRVHPEAMLRDLDQGGGLVYSQRVLLALTAAGLSRDEAYRLVQQAALAAIDGQGSFRELLAREPKVRAALPGEALDACFDRAPYLRNVDAIFARAEEPVG